MVLIVFVFVVTAKSNISNALRTVFEVVVAVAVAAVVFAGEGMFDETKGFQGEGPAVVRT